MKRNGDESKSQRVIPFVKRAPTQKTNSLLEEALKIEVPKPMPGVYDKKLRLKMLRETLDNLRRP